MERTTFHVLKNEEIASLVGVDFEQLDDVLMSQGVQYPDLLNYYSLPIL
jgi:hypothetical protein